MKRILEQELMNEKKQVAAYARADFSDSNRLYINNIVTKYSAHLHNVIDLGCGPADIPIELAKIKPHIKITVIDGSLEMIKLAREAVSKARLENKIIVIKGYMPGFKIKENSYDAIISKDLLHHLPDPQTLWNETKRLGKKGSLVYIMDLLRPDTTKTARKIVENIAANEDSLLKKDFYNSLCAAFTKEEIEEQLKKADLDLKVSQVSKRHMIIEGILK